MYVRVLVSSVCVRGEGWCCPWPLELALIGQALADRVRLGVMIF